MHKSPWFWILAVILFAYTVFFSLNQINQHRMSFNYLGHDFAQTIQALWRIVHFHSPLTTISPVPGSEYCPFLSPHLFVIVFLLTPLYFFFPRWEMLLILQTIAVAAGSAILFLACLRETRRPALAFIIALSFLFSPTVWKSFQWGFEASLFAPLFLFLAFYFARRGLPFFYFLSIILALFCKENVALYAFFFGFYLLLDRSFPRHRRLGIVTMGISLAYFLLAVGVVIPRCSLEGRYRYLDILAVTYWGKIVRDYLRFNKGDRLWRLFAPMAVLPFFSWAWVITIPGILTFLFYNLYCDEYANVLLVAAVHLAAISGAGRVVRLSPRLVTFVTVVVALYAAFFNVYFARELVIFTPGPDDLYLENLKARFLSPGCSVLTQERLAPHFAGRDRLFLMDFSRFHPPGDFEALAPECMFFNCRRAYCEPGFEFNELESIRGLVLSSKKYWVTVAQRGYVIFSRLPPPGGDDRANRQLARRWLEEGIDRYALIYGVQIGKGIPEKGAGGDAGP